MIAISPSEEGKDVEADLDDGFPARGIVLLFVLHARLRGERSEMKWGRATVLTGLPLALKSFSADLA